MNNGVFVGFSRIFLLVILIFKGLTARRLYKTFSVKGLTQVQPLILQFDCVTAKMKAIPFFRDVRNLSPNRIAPYPKTLDSSPLLDHLILDSTVNSHTPSTDAFQTNVFQPECMGFRLSITLHETYF
jgi:hypothetical protein